MDAAGIVREYGYLALAVGTFFEGEVIMSVGGWAARGGYLKLAYVMAAGAAGTVASDQVCFWTGRLFGARVLRRYEKLKGGVDRVLGLFDRYRDLVVLGFQFVPGSCTVVPFSLGLSTMPSLRFVLLDLVSAALWTSVFATGGYLFGAAMQVFVRDMHRFDAWIVAALVALVLLASYLRRRIIAAPDRGSDESPVP
jgi:membrane protein DedA with SNARE-associated domain